jgi:adenylate cyclase
MAEDQVQRKLAALLAADVAGYSRLMGADEEATLAALRRHRNDLIDPTIAKHGGRIANTAGDSVLAEFPSVVEALRCAIEIQRAMAGFNSGIPQDRRIEFRIGINVGDVMAQDGDLLGDGVNIAARLEGLAEPGGICISRAVRDQVRDRMDIGLEDMGEVAVKNIARPVRAFRVLEDGVSVPSPAKSPASGRRWVVAAAIGVVALAAGGGLWWWQPWAGSEDPARQDRLAHALPDRPSLAILPFTNLSDDRKQDYFADGFTEDLITNVAQSKELFVIARNSTFTYKGRAVKIRQVAEELGVRYVLEGSVRRVGEKMRITAQLIDATTGAHVWAKRYDEPTGKLFDIQDELSREIAGTLLANISKADHARALQKRPKDLSAYDYVLQSRARWAAGKKGPTQEARALAEKAIAADPNYAPAYAALGDALIRSYILQWDGKQALEQAYGAARKAVALDPLSPVAHELLGRVFLRRRQLDDSIASARKALSLNPNRARSYATLADALTFANRPQEAVALMQKAIRLDPLYPPLFNMYFGRALYFAKQYDKAVVELRACATRAPRWRPCYMFLSAAYAESGRIEDARRTAAELLKIAPKFSINGSVKRHLPFVPEAMAFYVRGLSKAGVPD